MLFVYGFNIAAELDERCINTFLSRFSTDYLLGDVEHLLVVLKLSRLANDSVFVVKEALCRFLFKRQQFVPVVFVLLLPRCYFGGEAGGDVGC